MNWKTRGERFETETEFDHSSLLFYSSLSLHPASVHRQSSVVASCTTTIHFIELAVTLQKSRKRSRCICVNRKGIIQKQQHHRTMAPQPRVFFDFAVGGEPLGRVVVSPRCLDSSSLCDTDILQFELFSNA